MQRYTGGPKHGVLYTTNNTGMKLLAPLWPQPLTPAAIAVDSTLPVNVVSRLDSTYVGPDDVGRPRATRARRLQRAPSQLSGRMFSSLGELRDTYLIAFVLIVIASW